MTELIKLIRELLQRFVHESPDTYKKIQWFVGIFTTVLGLLLAGNSAFDWNFVLIIVPILKINLVVFINYLITLLTGVFLVSFTPVKDHQKLNAKLNKKK